MRRKRRNLIVFMMGVCLLVTGCTAAPSDPFADTSSVQPDLQQTEIPSAEEQKENQPDGLPALNEVISGFTLERIDEYAPLKADILTFRHEGSGAQLCYIKNDDPNRAFAIAFRTPQVDETDACHIFEHAVIASSEKYPSKNLFFDIEGKSYNTFFNAFTYLGFTIYPVSSLSEEQLLKLADVTLSCMVKPTLMEDERFFKREALRYMLYDVDEPITMGGTVFSEDMGYMSSTEWEALNNFLDSMYPGEYASNLIGRAHVNYRELTYEHMKENYDRAYHFDNAMLLLYGDLKYRSFLEFFDTEYLSKAEKSQTDLSTYDDPQTASGYVENVVYAPAYEGDSTENASIIYYGMDLDGQPWENVEKYVILAKILNSPGSVFQENLKKAGLTAVASCDVSIDTEKPSFFFELEHANPEDAGTFKAAVDQTLSDVADSGLDPALVETSLKASELYDYTMAEDTSIVIMKVFPMILMKWMRTGETDIFVNQKAAFEVFKEDSNQTLIRQLAADLGNCSRSALITTVPKPGLAEQIVREQEEYLAEMKASMTEEELEQMVADTLAFDEWNAMEQSNSDFVIPVQSLPDLQEPAEFTKETINGVTYYTSAAEVEKVGSHSIMFDTSSVPQEDLHYLVLYSRLMTELATEEHSRAELDSLAEQYLYELSFNMAYPDERAGENNHPIFYASWNCLSEDYGTSLDLLQELLGELKLDDEKEILRAIDKHLPTLDQSKGNAMSVAKQIALAGVYQNQQYQEYLQGQRCYDFLLQLRRQLDSDPGAMEALRLKLQSISEQILHKDRMIVINIAEQEELQEISSRSREVLSTLPSLPEAKAAYQLPEYPEKTAVIVEGYGYNTYAANDISKAEAMSGIVFPFISALSDRYIVPKLRFQGLAYTALYLFEPSLDYAYIFSMDDSNVTETIHVIDGQADALASMELTQEELNSYIVKSYSSVTEPKGPLGRAIEAIRWDILGFDEQKRRERAHEMKMTTVKDQPAAVEMMRRLSESQHLVTAGNAEKLQAEAEQFDKVYDYRKPLEE